MRFLRIFAVACLLTWVNGQAFAQDKKPDWRKLHYLSEKEMLSGEKSTLFTETNPPSGDYVRFPAEFEPMQAVTIRYPLGIPTSLVKQLSERTKVYVIVTSQNQNSAKNTFQNAGCNMSNITYYNMTTDSYWVRDYGPWYIFNDLTPAIVDNVYNRPRQNDNMVPYYMGQRLGLSVYGMNLTHTGGNMMEDGRGVGVSDELVLNENNNDETNVRNKMRNYLGIDPYHITIDPQGDYIAHVDCWGKLLAPDKILIAQLPVGTTQYDEYEQVAEFFANTNCCWGYPYKVYRVYEPGGSTLAPYTNSLIVNNTVFVPLGSNTTHNNNALAVYQQAMPGYEIIGVTNNTSHPWENTDALHCRTRGVMDFDMLFVDHRDVVFGEQPMQDSIAITSKFIAYSGEALKTDSLLIYYSIDNGAYRTAKMTATGNLYEYVGYIKGYHYGSSVDYYVFGADESGHRYTQPSYGALEPHHFTIEEGEETMSQIFTLSAGCNWWSTNLEITLADLEAALGNYGVSITSQDGSSVANNATYGWGGDLTTIEVGKMYMIQTTEACTITVSGTVAAPAAYPITLNRGSNWIGFVGTEGLSLDEALSNLTPNNLDNIKLRNSTATYFQGMGWRGSLTTLEPGKGYIYNSKATTSKTFTFPSSNETKQQ
jgi:agmatine/peptidylarginine deiminase